MIKRILNECINGHKMSEFEAFNVMNEIMAGEATASQIASFLSILRFRGETVDEMTGFVKAMRSHMISLDYQDEEIIDTCGTGGDGASTFNISTAAAIVVSALGVKVAKHGNRAISSKSGSADVLEQLGIEIQATPDEAKHALNRNGMSFLFAPIYHSAMRNALVPRKEIGFRTVFNLLGPLANPARCKKQVIGVYSIEYAKKMAETLKNTGSTHVLLVSGRDYLDEFSITTETDVIELKNGVIREYVLAPEDVGIERGNMDDIRVSSASESAEIIRDVFNSKSNLSARNIVVLNASAALYIAGKVESIAKGVVMVNEALDSGLIRNHYDRLSKNEVQRYVK
ncbi:anthranilate phosphoribosyltransferase [Bacillus timonensis]|nr:anthranilate phosphoribosyltransferase [Bacillus timonensis]